MRQALGEIGVSTDGRGLYEVTRELAAWVVDQEIQHGLLTVFIRHTSASLTIQENADPDVVRDLGDFLDGAAPDDPSRYRHTSEGVDDMPAHIRAALTDVSLTVPVIDGRPALGTWQGVFVCEHRFRPHRRKLALHLIGE
ncbi:MAG: YjbQ family protein [Deltaproteobacteria bacterium]|jgi:secondary thiamine-phosphate synthase enzyme|nr:YjbQ family protein [Deltaproteobacteria bacterium]